MLKSTSSFRIWNIIITMAIWRLFKVTLLQTSFISIFSLHTQHGILPKEEISILHLEPVPGNAQRVFAATGCSIKVFLMVSGKPLEYLKDIHVRPISAILFFRPLKLLLTAAKDGSSKYLQQFSKFLPLRQKWKLSVHAQNSNFSRCKHAQWWLSLSLKWQELGNCCSCGTHCSQRQAVNLTVVMTNSCSLHWTTNLQFTVQEESSITVQNNPQ